MQKVKEPSFMANLGRLSQAAPDVQPRPKEVFVGGQYSIPYDRNTARAMRRRSRFWSRHLFPLFVLAFFALMGASYWLVEVW